MKTWGPSTGADHVLRGGGWDYIAQSCRAADRYHYGPVDWYHGIGFRLVLSSGQQ